MADNGLDQNYLKTLTVLYVEDDDDTREQFSEYLRHPVGTLITAGNGAEGLEAFITYAPDIVITDILMPLMDGLTMSCEIRGRAPQVPIIVLTRDIRGQPLTRDSVLSSQTISFFRESSVFKSIIIR